MLRRLSSIRYCCLFFISCHASASVIINEIFYNPPDENTNAEYIELYNPDPDPIDLTGYKFIKGIQYTFPEGTILESKNYLILAKNMSEYVMYWRKVERKKADVGPYEGKLSNRGETLILSRPDGFIVDSVQYDDRNPWPLGADGYGASLERISPDLPSGDYHSWRASLVEGGTPKQENSVSGVPSHPFLQSIQFTPQNPTSSDSVDVRCTFDSPELISTVNLQWEYCQTGSRLEGPVFIDDEWRYWPGNSAPSDGLEWTTLPFDDSEWEVGKGAFGYADGNNLSHVVNYGTPLPRNNTIFIRKIFYVEDPSAMGDLDLNIYADSGFICYINGVEVAKERARDRYNYRSLATELNLSSIEQVYPLGSADNYLVPGENCIACVGFDAGHFFFDRSALELYLSYGKKRCSTIDSVKMNQISQSLDSITFEAQIPPFPSQTLVRFNTVVILIDGTEVRLPFQGEPKPYGSYFVYDGEIHSLLPILWVYGPKMQRTTHLTQDPWNASGVVIQRPEDEYPRVFDGALVLQSRGGAKIRFLKEEEYMGNRTLNMTPERPRWGNNPGLRTPFHESIGYWLYRQMNVLAPQAEWYRVIYDSETTGAPKQQLIFQQINECFLELNGRNPDGDLYKRDWDVSITGYFYTFKKTNIDTGYQSYDELVNQLETENEDELHNNIQRLFNVENAIAHHIVNTFISHFDGFNNNYWLYYNLEPDGKWEILPWDLDNVWMDSDQTGIQVPPTYPKTGGWIYDPDTVNGSLHKDPDFHQMYLDQLREELDHHFSEDSLFPKIELEQNLLLADLDFLENEIGQKLNDRRRQIIESFQSIKDYIQKRRAYLLSGILPEPTAVENWNIY